MKNCINLSIPQFKQAVDLLGEVQVSKILDTFDNDYIPSYEEIVNTTISEPKEISNKTLVKEVEWIKDNLGDIIKVEILQDLIKSKAMGAFKDASIYLYENAEEGTAYHEAFHAVFQMFLDSNDRQSILDEFKTRSDYKDILDEIKESYPELSEDKLIEEALAEDFREYILTEGKSKYPKIQQSFFTKLLNFIKNLFIDKIISIDELYKNISSGQYRQASPLNTDLTDKYSYKKINFKFNFAKGEYTFDEADTKDLLDGVNHAFFQVIFKDGNPDILFSKNKDDVNKIYDEVREIIKQRFLNLLNNLNNQLNTANDTQKDIIEVEMDYYYNLYSNLLGIDGSGNNTNKLTNWNNLVRSHADYLSSLNISIANLENKDAVNPEVAENTLDIDSTNEETGTGGKGADLGKPSIKFNTKNGMPKSIKMLVAGLPKLQKVKTAEGMIFKPVMNRLGLPILTDFDTTYNFLADKLAGTPAEIELFQSKLEILATQRPELSTLIKRLNSTSSNPLKANRLNIEFIQSFAKTKIEYLIGLIKDSGNITFIESNSNKLVNKIKDLWSAEYRNITPVNSEGVFVMSDNQLNTLKVSLDSLKLPNINKIETVKQAYNSIGISLSNGTLVEGTKNNILESILKDIIEFGTGQDLLTSKEVSSKINQLATLESKYSNEVVELQHINAEGETVYGITLNSYLSLMINTMNEFSGNKEQLLSRLPHLNNTYAQNSLIINKILKGEKLNLNIIDGYKNDKPGETGAATKDLKAGDKLSQFFNSTLQGNYTYLRAADRGIENSISINNNELLVKNIGETVDLFIDYLKDEINSAKEFNLNGVGKDVGYYSKLENGEIKPLGLRVFDNIITFSESKLETVLRTDLETDNFIDENRDLIINDINIYLKEQFKLNLDKLKDLGVTDIYYPKKDGKEDTSKVYYQGIDQEILDKLSPNSTSQEEKLTKAVELFTINHLVGYIEMTKLITGDPAFYKSPVDFFKRVSMTNGTKKVSAVGNKIDSFMNQYLERLDNKTNDRDKIKSLVYEDVTVVSNYASDEVTKTVITSNNINYLDKLGNKVEPSFLRQTFTEAFIKDKYQGDISDKVNSYLAPYLKADEGDAQGYVTLDEYRDILWRAGDWTDSHEKAYTKAVKGETLSKEDFFYFQPLKTQYMGYMVDKVSEKLYVPTGYKHSLMPLIPSVLKGREMSKLLDHMVNTKTGIAQFRSANKFGTIVNPKTGRTNSFYNKDGINTENLINQTIDYRFFGIQLDISPEIKKQITASTQQRKLILSNLFENGKVAKDAKYLENTVIEYIKIQNQIIDQAFNNIKEELGVKRNDEGKYLVESKNKLVKYLTRAAKRRTVNDNVLDSIQQLLDEDITIDSLLNKDKVENLLMSLIDSGSIREKRTGGANIQGASTGFESINFKRNSKTNNYLKFYRKDSKGNIFPMEVEKALPKEWVSSINKQYGNLDKFNELIAQDTILLEIEGFNEDTFKKLNVDINLRKLIGFRIPNQGLNSTDAALITRFLPTEVGDIIIVPTEMVSKAGSDFDIDKLNLYLPNYIIREKVIGYNSFEESTIDLAKLQNRLLELQFTIVTDKYNQRQLLSPISDSIMKEMVGEIRELKGKPKDGVPDTYTNLVEGITNLDKFIYFLSGKSGVGQTAVHITNHILAQMANLYVSNKGRSTNLFFDHNTVTIDGKEYPSLANIKDVKGNWISETLSAFINAYVDIAKDPYIFDLNAGTSTANTIFYMLRLGADPMWVAKFMTQPSISLYVKEQSKNETEFKKAKGKELSQGQLVNNIITKYDVNRNFQTTLFGLSKDLQQYENSEVISEKVLSEKLDKIKKISSSYKKVSEKELSDFIRNNEKSSLSLQDKEDQIMLLDQFLEYQRQAVLFQEMVRASSPDTKGLGKNLNQLNDQIAIKEKVRKDEFIGNFDNLFKDSIISSFEDVINSSSLIMENYFLSELPDFKERLSELKTTAGLLSKDKEKIKNLVDTEFINYILTTTVGTKKKLGVHLEDNLDLFYGKNTLAKELLLIKRGIHPVIKNQLIENLIIKTLIPIVNKDLKQDNIKFNNKKLLTHETNVLISSWNEIYIINPEFAEKLMKFSILQSGISTSAVTFTQLIPSSKYFQKVLPIIRDIKNNPDIINFNEFVDQFYRKNHSILPSRRMIERMGEWFYERPKEGSLKAKYPYLKTIKKNKNNKWIVTLFTRSGEPDAKGIYNYSITKEIIGDGMYLMGYSNSQPSVKIIEEIQDIPDYIDETESSMFEELANEISNSSKNLSNLLNEGEIKTDC